MLKTIYFQVFACCAVALTGTLFGADDAFAGRHGHSTPTDATYHTIMDHTQANHINVAVTNTQSTTSARSFPYVGSDVNPWAAVNPALFPAGYTPNTPDLYVEVDIRHSDVRSSSLTAAKTTTCDQGDTSKCPSGTVPVTFVHRLGTYSSGTVTALPNAKLSGGVEELNDMFTQNGQAFDMDRLRYAANHLWAQWRDDKLANTGWATLFTYQPTGTMSFENFIYNVVNNNPMYGFVRVMVPVDSTGASTTTGDMFLDPAQPVGGAEFTTSHTWSGTGTSRSSPRIVDYEAMIPGTAYTMTQSPYNKSGSSLYPYSGTMTVYGMVLFDYIDMTTYDPTHFFDANQDYIDNYADIATHDAASLGSRVNVILPRSSGRNIVLMDWDTLNINPVNDTKTFVQYTDTQTIGADGRMDSMDVVRRKYLAAKSTSYVTTDVPDAYVWEYWMRKAAALPVGDSTRTGILSDLTGATPQYVINNEAFNSGAARRTTFDSTEWSGLANKDKFHAFFPNGYERGWMMAFDALRMATLDAGTTETTAGSWWMHLADDVAGTDGVTLSKGYPTFEVPDDAEAITIDVNGDGTATKMPLFFSTDWEDFPALAFAGGLLDVHGHMNTSGMLYTPDSCEIEAHGGSEVPNGGSSSGPFQYVNGAILAGNGIWLEDQDTGDHSMIGVSYNYNSFDRLRSGSSVVTIKAVSNIAELKGA